MKTRTLIVVVVIIMAVFALTGSGEKKTTIDESTMLEVMSGTWVNPDYNNKENYAAKTIVNPDGSYDLYKNTGSDQRSWYGDFTSVEAWTDSEGTYWYKATYEENWAFTAYHELGKIDSAKSVWEMLIYRPDFPDEWDPDNIRYTYRIFYRQE